MDLVSNPNDTQLPRDLVVLVDTTNSQCHVIVGSIHGVGDNFHQAVNHAWRMIKP